MSRILNISFTRVARSPRVMRQAWLLERDHQVTVIGYGEHPAASVQFIPLDGPRGAATGVVKAPSMRNNMWRALKAALRIFGVHKAYHVFLKLRLMLPYLCNRFERIYWAHEPVRKTLVLARELEFDLVIAHDIRVLPVALQVAGEVPVLFDAHEYAPRQYEEDLYWRLTKGRLYNYLCKRYLPQAAGMVTVGEGIASEYKLRFGVDSVVIRNAPYYQDLKPTPTEAGRVRMIHHGGANPGRRIETFIEAMDHLDESYTLDLILVGNADYVDSLKRMARHDDRIRFLEPVPMPEICEFLNGYDLGLFCIPPVSFNQLHCLPNKVFEFVQARLVLVSGPTPEVAKLIDRYGFGVVSESFEACDFAAAIRSIPQERIPDYKLAAHAAAQDLCFERESEKLEAEVNRLLLLEQL